MAKLLDIGTTIYTVEESVSDRWFAGMPYHFEIVSGQISRINVGGYKEYVVHAENRLGRKSNLRFLKTSDLGRNFFLTYEECVEFAERETANYEKRWREPVSRPWRGNMLKQITEKEALKMYNEGKDVKILAPKFEDLDSEWIDYGTDMLSSLLDGIIYMTDEEEKTEVVFNEPISVSEPEEPEEEPEPEPEPEPDPDPEPKTNRFGKLNLDEGKIGALHRAGWTNEKIAEEMGTTGVTIGKRIKAMKERGDLE